MALLDDLLNDVADPALRARLRDQIAVLRKEKKFGLVFEHHLPELLCLYDAPIHRSARVARRNGVISQTYIVDSVRGASAVAGSKEGASRSGLRLRS